MAFRLRLGALLASLVLAPLTSAQARNGATEVDVELVFAVDISYSMDTEEQKLQRNGYVEALRSEQFLNALKSGGTGRIAVALANATSSRPSQGWLYCTAPIVASGSSRP